MRNVEKLFIDNSITGILQLICLHFRRTSFKVDVKKTILNFNVYYVTQGTLLFIFSRYSLHKLKRLINSVFFQVRSLAKNVKHGKYSVKVHSETYSTCYMKTVRKIQYKFVKINWFTGWHYSSTLTRYYTFEISYRKRQHIYSALSLCKRY